MVLNVFMAGFCLHFLLAPFLPAPPVAAVLLSVAVVGWWLATAHWALLDLLACGLGVFMIALIRLPNLRVCTLLLLALLLYDVFWVFLSERFFSSNVMVVGIPSPTHIHPQAHTHTHTHARARPHTYQM